MVGPASGCPRCWRHVTDEVTTLTNEMVLNNNLTNEMVLNINLTNEMVLKNKLTNNLNNEMVIQGLVGR